MKLFWDFPQEFMQSIIFEDFFLKPLLAIPLLLVVYKTLFDDVFFLPRPLVPLI